MVHVGPLAGEVDQLRVEGPGVPPQPTKSLHGVGDEDGSKFPGIGEVLSLFLVLPGLSSTQGLGRATDVGLGSRVSNHHIDQKALASQVDIEVGPLPGMHV